MPIINKNAGTTTCFDTSNVLAFLQYKDIVNTPATSRNDGLLILTQEYQTGGTFQDKPAFQLNLQDILSIANADLRNGDIRSQQSNRSQAS